jgi:hypothetical protein
MNFKQNTRFDILTPTGWQPFSGVRKVTKTSGFTITLSNDKVIECSDTHRFISNGIEVSANELVIGSILDNVSNTNITIKSIEPTNSEIELYDIVEVDNGNLFIVDDIVSHNCDFITSGNTVVDGATLQWYEQTHVSEPLEKRGFDGNLWIWEPPTYGNGKDYIVCADVARGDGSDFSAFHVIDVETMSQVAEYKGQIDTTNYGNMLVNIATEYNDALLVIENSNIGWATIQVVINRGYRNLYYSPKDSSLQDVSQQLARYVDLKDTSQMVAGFTNSAKTRPLIISKMQTYMRDRSPIIRSKRLIEEMFVFIYINGRPEAQHGYHDDLVMSFSIGLWIRDTALILRQQGIELNKKTLDYMGNKLGAINATNNNLKDYGWAMSVGNNQTPPEDLTWLI